MRGHYGNSSSWASPAHVGAVAPQETASSVGGLIASVAVLILGANIFALKRQIKELESRPAPKTDDQRRASR